MELTNIANFSILANEAFEGGNEQDDNEWTDEESAKDLEDDDDQVEPNDVGRSGSTTRHTILVHMRHRYDVDDDKDGHDRHRWQRDESTLHSLILGHFSTAQLLEKHHFVTFIQLLKAILKFFTNKVRFQNV